MTTQAQHRRAKARSYTHCKVCGKPKPPPPQTRYVSRLEYERDPYCSTVCCKLVHDPDASSTPTSS